MKLTFEDTIGFLINNIKLPFDLSEDMRFQEENLRAIQYGDALQVMYRLGRTDERYGSSIKTYKIILGIVNTLNPPNMHVVPPLYSYPMTVDYRYRNDLAWLTENILTFIIIKIAKDKGVDWILDRFGNDVKRWYYAGQNPQG